MAAARVRIQTLGSFRIEVDGRTLQDLPAQPIRAALLLYLAVEGSATRDALTALLWPDRDSDRARHSLSQTLYELRRQLGPEWVSAVGETLHAQDVTVDAVEFSALVAEERDEEAVMRYQSEFLHGVHTGSSAAFEQWVDQRRSRFAREYRAAARRRCAALQAAGLPLDALQVAQRWAELDPLDDEANHSIIALLASLGQRTAALRWYDGFEARLRAELDVAPVDDTRALVEALRSSVVAGESAANDVAHSRIDTMAADGADSGIAAGDAGVVTDVRPGEAPGTDPKRRLRGIAAVAATMLFAVLMGTQLRDSTTELTREQTIAADLVVRGREYLNRPGEADVRKFGPAIDLFHQALLQDPENGRALTGLSDAYRMNAGLPMGVRRDSALHYGRRAAVADPASASAHASLGWAMLLSRQWDSAATSLRRAHQLDASHAETLSGLARLAWAQRRFGEGVRWQRQAVRADPATPRHAALLGAFLFDLGDLPGAEAALRQSLLLGPDAPAPAWWLAQLHLIRNQPDSADAVMQRMIRAAAGHPGAEFLYARTLSQLGRHDEASALLERVGAVLQGAAVTVRLQRAGIAYARQDRALLASLLADVDAELRGGDEGVAPTRLRVQAAALRGDIAGAVALLRRSWEGEPGGDPSSGPQLGFYWLDRDPLLQPLYGDAAFQSFLAQVRGEIDAARSRLSFD